MMQAEDRRSGGRAAASGRAEKHSGDETGEEQPAGKHHHAAAVNGHLLSIQLNCFKLCLRASTLNKVITFTRGFP